MKQDFTNKRVVVVGAGLSGQALVRFLLARGATVAISDRRKEKEITNIEALADLPIRKDFGGHTLDLFEQADLIALSPGVPLTIAPLERARSCNIPILGEVELAAREIEGQLIAITGTNGKSTTTSLIGHFLGSDDRAVFVGGNLGTPLVTACEKDYQAVVVELSSFQLETVARFHPGIAILLNLSPDHLDRYQSLESYYHAKLNVFRNMEDSDYAVLNADDDNICRLAADIKAKKVWFSTAGKTVEGMSLKSNHLVWIWQGVELSFSLDAFPLQGAHNVENVMAALSAALLAGCDGEKCWSQVAQFKGLEHRMELIREIDGVRWINDSKGTNVGSVVKSIAGLKENATLIAGGVHKGASYKPLRPLLTEKVKHLILIGDAAQAMAEELVGCCEIRMAADMETAVRQAYALTPSGSEVLLSPACSSFDMYKNYEERGHDFARLVNNLPVQRGYYDKA